MQNSEEDATVILNLGSYDVHNYQAKDVKYQMKNLVNELKVRKENRSLKIVEIIPHLYNEGLNKKIKIVNNYVKNLCEAEHISFINTWDKFINGKRLYVKDGSQLNRKGKKVLGDMLTNNCPKDFLE